MSRDNHSALNWDELSARGLGRAYIEAGFGTKSRRTEWQRRDVLCALHELAGGKPEVVVDLADIMTAAGVPQEQVYNALDHLESEGMLRAFNGNCVMLLPKGIAAHEQAARALYRVVPGGAREPARRGPGLARALPQAGPDVARGTRRRVSLRTG